MLIDLLVSFIVAFTSVRTVIDKTTRLFRLDEVHFVPEIARQIRWMTSRLRLINRSTSFDNYQKPRTEVGQTSERSVCVVVAVVVIEQKKKNYLKYMKHAFCWLIMKLNNFYCGVSMRMDLAKKTTKEWMSQRIMKSLSRKT